MEALSYAYSKGYPIVGLKQKPHFFLDKHRSEWENLSFFLSLSGQLPVADGLQSIRVIEEDKIIKCFTENSRLIEIEYDKIHLIDDLGVGGLPLPKIAAKKEYLVFDWLRVVRGQNHPYDYIVDDDSDDDELLHDFTRPQEGSRIESVPLPGQHTEPTWARTDDDDEGAFYAAYEAGVAARLNRGCC